MTQTDAQIDELFEEFEVGKAQFVQSVSELAAKPQHVMTLRSKGVVLALRPLLGDANEAIQQSAALALGRLVSADVEMAQEAVDADALKLVTVALEDKGSYFKKSAAYIIRAIAKHSERLAQSCCDAGAVPSLVHCLTDPDIAVREGSSWALDSIAKHSSSLADQLISSGALPLLVKCLDETEPALTRVTLNTLISVGRHSPTHAGCLTKEGVSARAMQVVFSTLESKISRLGLRLLSTLAMHGTEYAEMVVVGELFPRVYNLLHDADEQVRYETALLVREVAKHTAELASLVVHTGGLGALVAYGNGQPVVEALGYISSHADGLAWCVLEAGGSGMVVRAVSDLSKDDETRTAAAWCLHKIGKHGPEHARVLTNQGALPALMDAFLDDEAPDDLKVNAKLALKAIIAVSYDTRSLETLLHPKAPQCILKYLCKQYAAILPEDIAARKEFVANRGLSTLQRIDAPPGSELSDAIRRINQCFPSEVVSYFDPSSTVFDTIDSYVIR